MSYSLRTNYTNNVTNSTLRSSTNPYSSIVTTRLVTGTQAGAYLYNYAYLHANSGYQFTSINDLTFELDGSPYTNGSGAITAYLSSGKIVIQTVEQNPNVVYNLVLNGAATVVPVGGGDDTPSTGSGGITSNPSLGIGNSYTFNHYNNIQIKNKPHFNELNKVDDWAISFWVNIPPSQSLEGVQSQALVQKKTLETYWDANGIERTRYHNSPQYPFDIGFNTEVHPTNPGHVFVKASDGNKTLFISSSQSYNDGLFHHYVINKSGTELSLHIDGTKDVSGSYTFAGTTLNDRDILLGSSNISQTGAGFSGSIAQFRIHRTSLNNNVVSSLADNSISGSALQRNHAGYVFYKHGMIVVSDPRPRYQNIFLGDGNWDYTNKPFQLNYRATKTIEEVSILCELNKNEFNVSSNPSLRLTTGDYDPRLKPMITGSDFRPYITQIGLYNDSGDLLAIAKLGSPLKKRQDVDVTINVRFDID